MDIPCILSLRLSKPGLKVAEINDPLRFLSPVASYMQKGNQLIIGQGKILISQTMGPVLMSRADRKNSVLYTCPLNPQTPFSVVMMSSLPALPPLPSSTSSPVTHSAEVRGDAHDRNDKDESIRYASITQSKTPRAYSSDRNPKHSACDTGPPATSTSVLDQQSPLSPAEEEFHVNELITQIETQPITEEQLANEVRMIYAGLVLVERKCVEIDCQQTNNTDL
ncbi:hypothetical protein LOZ66_006786 [Ophidiomyces ophidiicola]|nr:hypothetical protein LOZ66_006786 [Ophidiomyces ophidiicola]